MYKGMVPSSSREWHSFKKCVVRFVPIRDVAAVVSVILFLFSCLPASIYTHEIGNRLQEAAK